MQPWVEGVDEARFLSWLWVVHRMRGEKPMFAQSGSAWSAPQWFSLQHAAPSLPLCCLSAGSSAASLPPVSTATPSTNTPRRCPHRSVSERGRQLIDSGCSMERGEDVPSPGGQTQDRRDSSGKRLPSLTSPIPSCVCMHVQRISTFFFDHLGHFNRILSGC